MTHPLPMPSPRIRRVAVYRPSFMTRQRPTGASAARVPLVVRFTPKGDIGGVLRPCVRLSSASCFLRYRGLCGVPSPLRGYEVYLAAGSGRTFLGDEEYPRNCTCGWATKNPKAPSLLLREKANPGLGIWLHDSWGDAFVIPTLGRGRLLAGGKTAGVVRVLGHNCVG